MNKEMINKWDKRFYKLAKHIATWSKDTSTKVGAVIVSPDKRIVATGYNGMPSKIYDNHVNRWSRPDKYFWVEHAERNAIYQAAKHGISIEGCSIYVTTFPCADCARAIIQSGIKYVISTDYPNIKQWIKSWEISHNMLDEAEIKLILINENTI